MGEREREFVSETRTTAIKTKIIIMSLSFDFFKKQKLNILVK